MSCSPSVSAVIAVYHPDPLFFRQAVSSVLEQTYPVRELIIVNDGGNEGEVAALLPADSRIILLTKNNGGIASARNYAIQHCSGEYIAFLDQDDYWFRDKLEKQIALIPDAGGPCMIAAPVEIVDEGGMPIRKKTSLQLRQYSEHLPGSNLLWHIASGNFIYSSTPLVCRSIFASAGGFDPAVQPHDDWDMYLRIIQSGAAVHLCGGAPLSAWRMHGSNESRKLAGMSRTKCRILRKLAESTQDSAFRKAVTCSYLIETLDRDHLLLYNTGRLHLFRNYVAAHTLQLMKSRGHAHANRLVRHLEAERIRKLMVKTARRVVLSYFFPPAAGRCLNPSGQSRPPH
jgi:glycosyltransferase involved in cell wall biosynthesis